MKIWLRILLVIIGNPVVFFVIEAINFLTAYYSSHAIFEVTLPGQEITMSRLGWLTFIALSLLYILVLAAIRRSRMKDKTFFDCFENMISKLYIVSVPGVIFLSIPLFWGVYVLALIFTMTPFSLFYGLFYLALSRRELFSE